MAIRQLPVVGNPTTPPAPLRKIAIEEHFIDPAQVHPNYGDSFSGEFDQEGSIETAPIAENDRRKICYGNAATLFGLPAESPRALVVAERPELLDNSSNERYDLNCQVTCMHASPREPAHERDRQALDRR